MKRIYILTLIALSASFNTHAAATKTSARAAARRTTFTTAQKKIISNEPVAFMTLLKDNPGIERHTINKCSDAPSQMTQECHIDLLKVAIGTLQEDRTFYVEQLLRRGAKLSEVHIASCALAIDQKTSTGTVDQTVLKNLTKLFHTLHGHKIARYSAEVMLQQAVRNIASAKRDQISNMHALLATVGLDIHALDQK